MNLTTEQFIEKAQAIHGNKYQYHETIYSNRKSYVNLICPVHGRFSQSADSHLQGKGCHQCGILKNRKNASDFITQASALHNSKYNYDHVEYISAMIKVKIRCPIHGIFLQRPMGHLVGYGCPQCGGKHNRSSVVLTTNEFIQKACAIHGHTYDYSLSYYKNNKTKIQILCRKHGIFTQLPKSHLEGQGCPRCGHYVSNPETKWLDSLNIPIRQFSVELPWRKVKVDGYDPITNTIYQFHGDYYHGNPKIYSPDTYNKRTKCTMGELYNRTIAIENGIRQTGYNLVVMWLSDWKIQ